MKRLLATIAIALACSTGATMAQTETANWPEKPVKFVVPFQPGSGAETMVRVLGEHLSQAWGQPVVVENRTGGNTVIAAGAVINSEADGYTFLLTTAETVTSVPYLDPKPGVDVIGGLKPIVLIARSDLGLVTSVDSGFENLDDVVAAAEGGKRLSVATLGVTSPLHYLSKLFGKAAGIELQTIPYQGIPEATQANLGGETDLSWANAFAVKGLVEAGKLRVLAISGESRNPQFPDVPTFAEQGFDNVTMPALFAAFAPTGTPEAIVEKLNADIQTVLASDFRTEAIEARGFQIGGAAFGEFEKLLERDRMVRQEMTD